jgi:hypothetical protein
MEPNVMRAVPHDRWDFNLTMERRWYWKRFGSEGKQKMSVTSFNTFVDCVIDAVAHGYNPAPLSVVVPRTAETQPPRPGVSNRAA